MATQGYGHLIKPLGFRGTRPRTKRYYEANNTGPETSKVRQLAGKKDLEGIDLSVAFEYHDGLGNWYGEDKPHVHDYTEVQCYVGLDTAAINYLGADMELCLGDDMVPYAFSEPTAVVVPAGVPHGPVRTTRMYSPRGFACFRAALTGTPGHAAGKRTPVKGKGLAKLVKPLKDYILFQRGKRNPAWFDNAEQIQRVAAMKIQVGPGMADHVVRMNGTHLEGIDLSLDWAFFSKPGTWFRGAGAHTNPADELVIFMGTDPTCPGRLGAEVELDLGPEHERHIINKPCAVICPAGLPHGPHITRWVDRPFAFSSVFLGPEVTMKEFD